MPIEQPLIPSSNNTVGAYVRRIVIPVDISSIWPKTLESNARRILLACPKALIFARRVEIFRARQPRRRNFTKIAIDDIQMPQLRRVDWNRRTVAQSIPQRRARDRPDTHWHIHGNGADGTSLSTRQPVLDRSRRYF